MRKAFDKALEGRGSICLISGEERLKAILGFKDDTVESSSILRLIDEERIELINSLSLKIYQISDIDNLLNEVISAMVRLTGARSGYLFMVNEENGKLEIRAFKSISDSFEAEYSNNIVKDVFKSGN